VREEEEDRDEDGEPLTSKGAPKSEETTIEFSGSLTRAGNETDPLKVSVAFEARSLSPKHI
jgi:hypothetical protein